MFGKEEKAKVGRPKLADSDLVKNAWVSVAMSLSIVLVVSVFGVGSLTNRTPAEVLSFARNSKASVASIKKLGIKKPVKVVVKDTVPVVEKTVVKAQKATKKIIKPNGEIYIVIPAK